MKYKVFIECEDEFERYAVADAVKNKLRIEGIYDEVFRKVIRYSEDEQLVEAYTKVWKNLSEYLDD